MAEAALAIIGLVSSIVQFVDFGGKVLGRLNEYKEAVDKTPKTFQKLSLQLPLLISSLERTKDRISDSQVSEEKVQPVVEAVEGCLELVKKLEDILAKLSPSKTDSSWTRRKKALVSLASDKNVEEISGDLDSYVKYFTYFLVALSSSPRRQVDGLGSPRSTTRPGTQRNPCFMMNYSRMDKFIGREDVIEEIDRRFVAGQHRVAITGIGGIGKSQIAIEYCYRYQKDHPEANIFWVHASNRARFVGAYNEIAGQLALPDADKPEVDSVHLVLKWLNNDAHGPWLLVLDNADDLETFFGSSSPELSAQAAPNFKALVEFLPRSSTGAMIITTRDRRVGQRLATMEKPISVLQFNMDDAKCLLRKTLLEESLNNDDSIALLEALEFLPMAIAQAAAFIREKDITLLQFLETLQSSSANAKHLLAEPYHDPARDPESYNSVFRTWRISFESIREQNPRAAQILSLMAVLDRQAVQEKLIQEENEGRVDFISAIGALKAFSLITEEREGGTFAMHRLVQLSTQRWLETENVIEKWQEKALHAVSKCCLVEDGRHYNWKAWEMMNPHVQVVLKFAVQSEACQLERSNVLGSAAIFDIEQQRIEQATAAAEESYAICERLLSENDPALLRSMSTLAHLAFQRSECEAAEGMFRKVLLRTVEVLGPDHHDSIAATLNLCQTLNSQAKYEAAEEIMRRVVESSKKAMGPIDRLTLICITALATSLSGQNMFDEAKILVQEAIDGSIQIFGAEHPMTLKLFGHQASIFEKEGRFREAEENWRQVIDNLVKVYGPRHMETITPRMCLLLLLEKQGRYGEAQIASQQLSECYETKLSPNHPFRVAYVCNTAMVLVQTGKAGEAEGLVRKKAEDLRNAVGADDGLRLLTLQRLASTLIAQCKFGAAEATSREVLAGCERTFGREAEPTLHALGTIAWALNMQGKLEPARVLAQQGFDGLQKLLGAKHPTTLSAHINVAELLEQQGMLDEAEAIAQEVFHSFEKTLGRGHSFTHFSQGYLAHVLEKQGNYKAAKDLNQKLRETLEVEYGTGHVCTLRVLSNIASVLQAEEKFVECEAIRRQVFDGFHQALGAEHPATISSLGCLSYVLQLQKTYDRAEVMRRQVLEWEEKMKGLDHPDTLYSVYCLACILYGRQQYDQALVLFQRASSGLSKALGPDHTLTITCFEWLSALERNGQPLARRPRHNLESIFKHLLGVKRAR